MQIRLFVIHVPVGIMILSLMLFSHIFTEAVALAAADAAKDHTDTEVEDKDNKGELRTSETKATNDDNTGKQEEEQDEDEEQQDSNDDTKARESGLEEDDVMIDDADTYSSDDGDDNNDDDKDVPFELPFEDIIPFP